MESSNASRNAVRNCSTCRPIRLTWTPSKRLGRNSKHCFGPPRQEPKKPSTKPSRNCFLRSPQRMQWHGSNTVNAVYSKRENALKLQMLRRAKQMRSNQRCSRYHFRVSDCLGNAPLVEEATSTLPWFCTGVEFSILCRRWAVVSDLLIDSSDCSMWLTVRLSFAKPVNFFAFWSEIAILP